VLDKSRAASIWIVVLQYPNAPRRSSSLEEGSLYHYRQSCYACVMPLPYLEWLSVIFFRKDALGATRRLFGKAMAV